MQLSDDDFQSYIDTAIAALPPAHLAALKNVAIIYEDEPSLTQRQQLQLHDDQTLFGLYEGVPLSQRQGLLKHLPDRITLFKLPLLAASADVASLKENIRHTVWHEIAHYFGLNHDQIRALE